MTHIFRLAKIIMTNYVRGYKKIFKDNVIMTPIELLKLLHVLPVIETEAVL